MAPTPQAEAGVKIPPIKICQDKFSDQVVVVTGAAQGIGRATADLFAAQGATLVLLDIQEDKLKQADLEIKQASPSEGVSRSAYYVCNISNEDEVTAAVEWIMATFMKIDILAHLAGIFPFHPLTNFPTDTYRKTMNVNLDATFFLIRSFIPRMQYAGYGRIVLTSSGVFEEPEPGLLAYVASKAGVIGMARAAAIEAGPGVTVNVVMPGLIKTPGTWDAGVQPDGHHPFFEHAMSKQVTKRTGHPEDIAHAICFLASPEASFITGQALNVSGGRTFH